MEYLPFPSSIHNKPDSLSFYLKILFFSFLSLVYPTFSPLTLFSTFPPRLVLAPSILCLLRITSNSCLSSPTMSSTSSFLLLSVHFTFSILLYTQISNVSSLLFALLPSYVSTFPHRKELRSRSDSSLAFSFNSYIMVKLLPAHERLLSILFLHVPTVVSVYF